MCPSLFYLLKKVLTLTNNTRALIIQTKRAIEEGREYDKYEEVLAYFVEGDLLKIVKKDHTDCYPLNEVVKISVYPEPFW